MTRKREGDRTEPMLVKKYAGRRLYNTATLRYATPGELRDMVDKGRPLVVRDAQSGDDITHEILDRLH